MPDPEPGRPVIASLVMIPCCGWSGCTAPSSTVMAMACRHEHVVRHRVCAQHREMMLTKLGVCGECHDAPGGYGHRCEAAVREEPQETAVELTAVVERVVIGTDGSI